METLTTIRANTVLPKNLYLDCSIAGGVAWLLDFFIFFLDGAKDAIKLATVLFR